MLRPRFTLRTLAIFVTLVCAYFGAWEATETWGIRQLSSTYMLNTLDEDGLPARRTKKLDRRTHEEYLNLAKREGVVSSPVPFAISKREEVTTSSRKFEEKRRYYIWFFGALFDTKQIRYFSHATDP